MNVENDSRIKFFLYEIEKRNREIKDLKDKISSLKTDTGLIQSTIKSISDEIILKQSMIYLCEKEVTRIKEEEEKQKVQDQKTLQTLIDLKLANNDGLFTIDCNGPEGECTGWDGISNRCGCRNRRVSWVLSDDKLSVYPECY